MVTAILALLAGLIAALPQILGLIEAQQAKSKGVDQSHAQQDNDLLKSVLPPPDGVQ